MAALHAMGEQGGWPLTMFLTPDGAPFFGGTYWPPPPRFGRPSFRQSSRRSKPRGATSAPPSLDNGAAITAHLATLAARRGGRRPEAGHLDAAGEALLRLLDPVHGGIGRAPKFPNAPIFRFLAERVLPPRRCAVPRWRCATSSTRSAPAASTIISAAALRAIPPTPNGMCRISRRCSTTTRRFSSFSRSPTPRRPLRSTPQRAERTFGWLMREMRVGDAFAASQDADQDGEEGPFYVWSEAEIDAALGSASAGVQGAYDVRGEGNWEGRNVLRRVTPLGAAGGRSQTRGLPRANCLRRGRCGRAPPLDDKILADWNGLMIAALARAASVFDAPDYPRRRPARPSLPCRRICATPRAASSIPARGGVIGAPAMLDDYAALARAALALVRGDRRARYLRGAIAGARGEGPVRRRRRRLYLTAADAADAPSVRAAHRA